MHILEIMYKDKKIQIHTNFIIILLTLISTVIFGIIRGILYILTSETIAPNISHIQGFDPIMTGLTISSINITISIFISSFIHKKIHDHFRLIESPFLDLLGIIIGSLIILGAYYLFKKYSKLVWTYLNNNTEHIEKINKKD